MIVRRFVWTSTTVVLTIATLAGQTRITPGSMPSAERVRAEIKGATAMDTAARQMGAFWQLRQIIQTLAGQRNYTNQLTVEERRLIGEYSNAYQHAGQPYAQLQGDDRPKWFQMHSFYETDEKFRDELLGRFVPAELRAEYLKAKGISDAQWLARSQTAQHERERIQAKTQADEAQAKGAAAAAAGIATGSAVLSVESAFGTQSGTRDPLIGKPLFLLKESFSEFLKREILGPQWPAGVSPLAGWAHACRTGNPLCMDALKESQSIFAGVAKIGENGKVAFPGVPPGRYYLLGSALANNQHLVWDLEVSLKPGQNAVKLDNRNIAPIDTAQTGAVTSARVPPAARDLPAAPPRPNGPRNSVITLVAKADHVTPIAGTTFYLLDDDFERILARAGFEHQMLLGKKLPLLSSFELLRRWMTMKDSGVFSMLEAFSGESALPPDVPEQHAIATKALSDHTVAILKTDIYGKGSSTAVPAGTYYVFGTANEFVKTGARGTLSGNTLTLSDTGYQKATIWNLKVTVKAGQNSVLVTPDNAAFMGQ